MILCVCVSVWDIGYIFCLPFPSPYFISILENTCH